MSKIDLCELLQQDIEDLKGLVNYKELGLTEGAMKIQARGIILNLQKHLEDFIQMQ
jgi:hypothetical protein